MLCINQGDDAEKKEQVKLMGTICSRPSRVLIWLGEDVTDLDGLQGYIKGPWRSYRWMP